MLKKRILMQYSKTWLSVFAELTPTKIIDSYASPNVVVVWNKSTRKTPSRLVSDRVATPQSRISSNSEQIRRNLPQTSNGKQGCLGFRNRSILKRTNHVLLKTAFYYQFTKLEMFPVSTFEPSKIYRKLPFLFFSPSLFIPLGVHSHDLQR